MTRRRFFDAATDERCQWNIKLRGGSLAQCGRRHIDGTLCTQHKKVADLWFCPDCEDNDELPPGHCT